MGYLTNGLTFRTLREANAKQLMLLGAIDNYYSLLGNSSPSLLPLNSWLRTVITELGDYIDTSKLNISEITRRLADTVIHVDILAHQLNIDLSEGIIERWNQKSEDLRTPIAINVADWHYTRELTGEERARLRGEKSVSVRHPSEPELNKVVPCPKCCEEGESLKEETELTCAYCGFEWSHDPNMTAAQIRTRVLLESIASNTSKNPREDANEVLKLIKELGLIGENPPISEKPLKQEGHGYDQGYSYDPEA